VTKPPPGPVAFIVMSMACAVFLGLLLITATVLLVDALRGPAGARNLDLSFYLLVGGTFGGIFVAGYAAWRLLSLIPSTYRRGALSLVAGFATVLLMLICIPIYQLLGRAGLYALLAGCGVLAALLGRLAASVKVNA
jgi:hypothetical protein